MTIALNNVDRVWVACGRVAQRYRAASSQIAEEIELVKNLHMPGCECDRCQLYEVLLSALHAPERLSAGQARRDGSAS